MENWNDGDMEFLGRKFSDSELVIGLVGAVGTELDKVATLIKNRLDFYGYKTEGIRFSMDVISLVSQVTQDQKEDEFCRINSMMNAGNEARKNSRDNSILAIGAASIIGTYRKSKKENQVIPKQAFVLNSLKHPDEVVRLREIYSDGFYLIGVYTDELRRLNYLVKNKRMDKTRAKDLIQRDEDEHLSYGQRVRDTYHLSDFFLYMDPKEDVSKNGIKRFFDILFGYPYQTPTFDEFAMFMAFSASLRSADLSRQVGAVLARNDEILSIGANDCPRYGGGLYWPHDDPDKSGIVDHHGGRDYTRQGDSNALEKEKMIQEILDGVADVESFPIKLKEVLLRSRLMDITEFGRVVHAEMEAILACARNQTCPQGATLYCTTFPCHNCAKHIVAAGIKRVVYVEPYPKSKALEFHDDSICFGPSNNKNLVGFEPFVGVGPRRFFDMFSMHLSSGNPMIRKNETGRVIKWTPDQAKLRIQMLPSSYINRETMVASIFSNYKNQAGENHGKL